MMSYMAIVCIQYLHSCGNPVLCEVTRDTRAVNYTRIETCTFSYTLFIQIYAMYNYWWIQGMENRLKFMTHLSLG